MYTLWNKLLCVILSLALLINLLPASALAAEEPTEQAVVQHWVEDPPVETTEKVTQPLEIVSEDTSKRGEYYKEFVLNNGLRMASMYAEPVHYSEGGQWKEIDNTLKLSDGAYTNTAGKWRVSFPQQLSKDKAVTVTKDGYTLSFFMAGELYRDTGSLTKAALGTAIQEQPAQLHSFQTATAQLQAVEQPETQSQALYPQTPAAKTHSRLTYANVSTGTDIVYDLNGNQVKESIIIDAYNAQLQGYRYTLNVGELNPVLTDSGEINLYDRDSKEIVMVMPAPFLVDDAGEYCHDVELTLTGKGGQYTLTYLLPQQWLADANRQWPVVLDPVVEASTVRTNIRDVSVYQRNRTSNNNDEYLDVGYSPEYGVMRSFLKYATLPELNSADVIVASRLTLTNAYNSDSGYIIEAHKVLETWESENTAWANQPDIDMAIEDYAIVQNPGVYEMDITDVVREWYEEDNTGLVLKVPDLVEESASSEAYWKQFFSADYVEPLRPQLTIYFRNTNGLESYWDYTASSAGRAGTGYVNNYSGNLVWVHNDMGYGGNRMPVSIKHIYNANDKAEFSFGAGYGWRTNYNQVLTYHSSLDGGSGETCYIWEDADGTEHCFYEKNGVYKDEDNLELTLTQNDDMRICMITDKEGNTYYFDSLGRLYMLENNQAVKSSIQITYTASNSMRISTVTDGAGRVYQFSYSGGLLTEIRYLGTENNVDDEAIASIRYEYSNGYLTKITYQDGESSLFTYSNAYLSTIQDIDDYKLTYTYYMLTPEGPKRVGSVQETTSTSSGDLLLFYYSHNQTKIVDILYSDQIKQFNSWGNLISVQDREGRTQFASYDSNDQFDGGKGNRLITSSKLQNTVSNLLNDGNFEKCTLWNTLTGAGQAFTSANTYYGSSGMRLWNNLTGSDTGVQSSSFLAAPGETYTFSAYIKTEASGSAYIALGTEISPEVSETLAPGQDWTRLQVSYTNDLDATMLFSAKVYCTPGSTVYVDCVQLEKAETASRYNLIDNGDFRFGADKWSTSEDCTSVERPVTVDTVAAPMLDNTAFAMYAAPYEELRLQQTVNVSGTAGDTFVLGGWAKGNAVPLTYTYRSFAIRGTFLYTDQSTEDSEFVFSYNYNADDWQYTSGAMVAKKDYSKIKVELLYEYNANAVYFDGIQLFKEEFGNSYTYDEDNKTISVRDLQSQTTNYKYSTSNFTDLLQIIQNNKAKVTYEYDNWHNVTMATTEEGVVYEFGYDVYGNNTSVSITSGTQTVTSTATYADEGKRLEATTDAFGKVTTYGYNPDTNVLEWVQYPQDTPETRTEYTYDEMYRIAQAELTTDTGLNLFTEYTYADDMITSIETASTIYSFGYGDFGLRSSVNIGDWNLADYTYIGGTRQLKRLDYGNGDYVQYTYDDQDRVAKQTYEDNSYVTYKYDNSGALATVYDSQSNTTSTYYYDFTDRMLKCVEKSGNNVHSVGYEYDDINNLTALVETINTVERKTSYSYDDDNRPTFINTDGRSRSYSYDNIGRVAQDDTWHHGTRLFVRSYTYRSGANGGTSNQPYRLAYSGNHFTTAFGYGFNAAGNIAYTNVDGSTDTYKYDSANQLIRENNSIAGTTTIWTYDNAGNILKREVYPKCSGTPDPANRISLVEYTYDEDWGDLLVAYNGVPITHDGIGNPLNDGTWTYTWQHGRQLASMSKIGTTEMWDYTYNADGLRTQRKKTGTDSNITYNYTYLGNQLTHMTVAGHTMYFDYDASGVPWALKDNGAYYYYVTNLQGDVIAILNASGTEVVRYTYNAWGNLTSTTGTMAATLGFYNPLRYRGYVYDEETKLYYLQSRYYNPEIGRFINADGFTSTGIGVLGYNAFAYCANNPLLYVDSTGNRPIVNSIDGKETKEERALSFAYMHERTTKDITVKLDEALAQNAATFTEYCDSHNMLEAGLYFLLCVKDGGVWDLKSQDDWNLNENATYIYHDNKLRFDAIGNIHYGYVGRVEYNLFVLLKMAGVAQIADGTSKWSYWNSNFDDPIDQWAIQFGYYLWDTEVVS